MTLALPPVPVSVVENVSTAPTNPSVPNSAINEVKETITGTKTKRKAFNPENASYTRLKSITGNNPRDILGVTSNDPIVAQKQARKTMAQYAANLHTDSLEFGSEKQKAEVEEQLKRVTAAYDTIKRQGISAANSKANTQTQTRDFRKDTNPNRGTTHQSARADHFASNEARNRARASTQSAKTKASQTTGGKRTTEHFDSIYKNYNNDQYAFFWGKVNKNTAQYGAYGTFHQKKDEKNIRWNAATGEKRMSSSEIFATFTTGTTEEITACLNKLAKDGHSKFAISQLALFSVAVLNANGYPEQANEQLQKLMLATKASEAFKDFSEFLAQAESSNFTIRVYTITLPAEFGKYTKDLDVKSV